MDKGNTRRDVHPPQTTIHDPELYLQSDSIPQHNLS